MKKIKFNVNGQVLVRDPTSSSSNELIKGTSGYLKALFSFSSGWSNCAKTAVFSVGKETYEVPIENNACNIPEAVTSHQRFWIHVVGNADPDYKIVTNKVGVKQT